MNSACKRHASHGSSCHGSCGQDVVHGFRFLTLLLSINTNHEPPCMNHDEPHLAHTNHDMTNHDLHDFCKHYSFTHHVRRSVWARCCPNTDGLHGICSRELFPNPVHTVQGVLDRQYRMHFGQIFKKKRLRIAAPTISTHKIKEQG